ncbi:hypothetical protein [Burkholderia plantarii]|uniref:hypothetical protein n=1 Tax=Burkholderia plantarii TaxID=41899 RepID=UPI000AD7DC20|nr:hypothetical protein [Burkholderia plantarii]
MGELHAAAILDDRLTIPYRRGSRSLARRDAAMRRTEGTDSAPHNARLVAAMQRRKRLFFRYRCAFCGAGNPR